MEIEQVNVGFMAVRVAAGRHSIEFRYKTPGLSTGIKISAAALVMIVVYLLAVFIRRRQNPAAFAVEYPEGEGLAAAIENDDWLIGEFSQPEGRPSAASALEEALAAAFAEDSEAPPDEERPAEIEAEIAARRAAYPNAGEDADPAAEAAEPPAREGFRKRRRHAREDSAAAQGEAHLLDRLFAEPEEPTPSTHGMEGGFTVHLEEETEQPADSAQDSDASQEDSDV